jgi:hypothetical protein
MFLIEGISIWPTIALRIVSFLLSSFLIWLTLRLVKKNVKDTRAEMHLMKIRFTPLGSSAVRRTKSTFGRRIMTMMSLRPVLYAHQPAASEYGYPILKFLVRFGYGGRTRLRVTRAFAATLVMMIISTLIGLILGFPNTPARGTLAKSLYTLVTFVDVFASLFLVFLVVDATLFSRSFIRELRLVRSRWPRDTILRYQQQLRASPKILDDWIDMQYISRRTAAITKLVYFPFIVGACLVISRSSVFTDFAVSATLIITWLIFGAVVVSSAVSLRWAAEAARRTAIDNMNAQLVAAKGRQKTGTVAQLENLLGQVESLQDGAFAPWSSQPVVRAFLLPLLTYGASVLVHGYALPGF